MNIESVLGIDLAQSWANTGIALVAFDRASQRVITVDVAVSAAPTTAFSAAALADVIHALAMRHGVRAVAIDGPLGWRDPSTPPEAKGVGRRCEVECRTQAKTGAYPTTYPNNQRPWVELSIAVFDALLARAHVVLANDGARHVPPGGYAVLECFPTSVWRSSGLAALPGKAARPDLGGYIAALRAAYDLPAFTTSSHDALQAVVAALAKFSEKLRIVEKVRTAGVVAHETRAWGPALVFERLWQQQGLPQILGALSRDRKFAFDVERVCFALALQRLCAPGSDLFGSTWLPTVVDSHDVGTL